MNQCLRCNKQCSVASLFCDECRPLVEQQMNTFAPEQSAHAERDVSTVSTSPHVSHIPPSQRGGGDSGAEIVERLTAPNPVVPSPRLSHPSLYSVQANRVEQALHKLSDAARRIAAAEPGDHRKPKNARLSPLRDISAEIQRHSTPMPQVSGQKPFSIDNVQNDDLGGSLPDLWPWLQDNDSDEIDGDSWSNRTDPLISRRFPDSVEAARIEEEDIQRVVAEGLATFSPSVPRKKPSRIRLAFASLAVLAILALTIDSILVSVAFLNKRPVPVPAGGPPTLTLSATNVKYGQDVWLHIHHFTPSSEVYVTRDVEEPIHLNDSKATVGPTRSMIRVDANGAADVSMYIENTWDPGYHTIEAEDIQTRYTASISLHIDDAGPTRPPHLVVDNLTIDLGAEPIGANSIRPLRMHNAGSGPIIWSASSDQPWLLLSPNQGTFSDNQTISVGGERANLTPKDYKGSITISSNVGISVTVQVIMTVHPLPTNAGAVLQVTPALLSFVATDGGASPAVQYLQVSNPGSQPLHWSLSNNAPSSQGTFLGSLGSSVNWLSTDLTSGTINPGATAIVRVNVQSQSLLPSTYTDTVVFSADNGAINSPQSINVSLTVQPQCSLQLSTNTLPFTAVQGQSNSNTSQSVSLSASASCAATTNWNAVSSVPWLMITPGSGQLNGVASATIAASVNITGLPVGISTGIITVTAAQNTQTIQVQLDVQAPPPPGAPILSLSQPNYTFTVNQGPANPSPQLLSITNTGGSTLHWIAKTGQLAGTAGVNISPSGGYIPPGETRQALVNAFTANAPAGTYTFQGMIQGFDANDVTPAGGSPQTIGISVEIKTPCTLAPLSSSSLAFNATQGGANPIPQTFALSASGNCAAGTVGWKVAGALPSWLNLSSSSGVLSPNGQSMVITVSPSIASLSAAPYTAQIPIQATDGSNQQLAGSPLLFTATLDVQLPCVLQTSVPKLTFSTPQGQSPQQQVLGVSENGTCSRPVSWSATSNSSWLVLSVASGLDNGGGGNVGAGINTAGLHPGTYNGLITLSANGNGGAAVGGSPQTIPVTLVVDGFTVGGSVNACATSACATSVPLAGATVTLTDSTGKAFTAVTDASGAYSLSGVALGTCTLAASGNNGTHYAGNASLTVAGNQTNVTINTVPS